MSEIERIEKSITYFKVHKQFLAEVNLDGLTARDLAIQALQEKQERENMRCENCTKHTPINNFAKDYSIEVDNKEISIWEDLKCLAHIKINYCPMCGRKLVE